MKYRNKKNHLKKFYGPKLLIGGIAIGVVLATVGSVGALNGWFGGGSDIPPDTLTRGLVGYWGFEEGSGTKAADASGNSNHGTLKYMTTGTDAWTKGKVGGALSFDGTDDYVDAGNGASLNNLTQFSWETWYYHNADSVNARIFDKLDQYAYLGVSGKTLDMSVPASTQTANSVSATSFTSGVWYHIIITYDDSGDRKVRIYFNGSEVSYSTHIAAQGTLTPNTAVFYLGNRAAGDRPLNGKLDEVRVYNRALSAEEVRYHYNRGGPVAQWKFDEGAGRAAYDSTDNNNDGTLVLAGSATSSAWVSGKYGSALSFDGVDDYVDAGSGASLDAVWTSFTVEAWIKSNELTPASRRAIVSKGTASGNNNLDINLETNGKIRFWFGNSLNLAYSASPIGTSWQHIVGVWNGTQVLVYLNGNAGSAVANTPTVTASGSPVLIGSWNTQATWWFNGLIDDVRIYNYARTPEEIRLDYNQGFAARFGRDSVSCGETESPAACMTEGLVGYWPFDEGSGTTARDSSNYANNGTLTSGPLWTKGKVGGALNFDGVDDRIQVADSDSLDITNAITMEAWIKLTGNTSQYDYVIQKVSDLYSMYFTDTTNQLRIIFTTSNGFPDATISTALTLNTWYHIVGTYDTVNGARIYSNGVLADTGAALGTINTGTGVLWIGGQGALYNLPAILDEVRIYNRALSAEEVRYHYNRGGPVAQWKFDEGEGRTAYDSTDNNNDGTLVLAGSATSSAWVSGKYGSALSFNGVDDYVDAGNGTSLQLTTAFTLEAWFRVGVMGSNNVIIGKGEMSAYANQSYHLYKNTSDKIVLLTQNTTLSSAGQKILTGATTISPNKWYHVVAIFDGSAQYLYLNGTREGSGSQSGTLNNPAIDFFIGVDPRATKTSFMNGLIDDVRIYNYARTPEEIRLDYNQGFAARFGRDSVSCGETESPAACVTEGLVGYWSFDEGSGVIARDSSDYSNNATTSGTAPGWTKGKVGGALNFDASDDYLSIRDSDSLDINDAITIEAWIYPEGYGGGGLGRIISKAVNTSYAFYLRSNGTLTFNSANSAVTGTSDGGVSLNAWHHVVATYDGSFVRIYVNGAPAGTTADTGSLGTNTKDLWIGREPDVADRFFDGLIDEVRIYNRALSAEEVRYHYNKGGPVGWWKMDEGEGRTVYDSTDNNNDGTLVLAGSATSSAWVAGKYGSALSFDGVNDYVSIPNSSTTSITGAITIEGWVKLDNSYSARGWIMSKERYTDSGNNSGYHLRVESDKTVDFMVLNNIVTQQLVTATVLNTNRWYHVVGVYAGSASGMLYVYIDGALDKSQSGATFGILANTMNVDIGAADQDGNGARSNFFNGLIDDVRIYNYARTPDEIRLDYNQGFAARFGRDSVSCGETESPAACMTQGLVGYWGFEEGSGTIAYDSSNYANNATTSGTAPSWTKGKVGGALNFDGSDDHVAIADADSLDTGQNITLEAWIKPADTSISHGIVGKWVSGGGGRTYLLTVLNDSTYGFSLGDSVTSYGIGNIPVTTNWAHIVGTYDGITQKIYVNGQLNQAIDRTITVTISTTPVVIGKLRFEDSTWPFKGLIDEVRIYNRALSAEEVRYHYNKGGPVGYWKMDEGEGRTVYDSTDNNNDGTLVLAGSATSSAWVSGKYGSALSFDGVDDYVQVADSNSLDITNTITLEAWVKLGQISAAADQAIIAKFDDDVDGGRSYRLVFANTNKFYIDVSADAAAVSRRIFTTTNTFTSANAWYHVVATADAAADDYKIYVNGASQPGTKTFSAISSIYTSTSNLTFGFHPIDTALRWFNGLIDDVRIYNYARTPSQIRLDYNQGLSAHFR